MADAPDPDVGIASLNGPTALSWNQRTLLQVLVEKDQSLGSMYIGAIMARAATDNPDHLSQASHSLRELIDRLPEHFEGVPVNPPTDSAIRSTRSFFNGRKRNESGISRMSL